MKSPRAEASLKELIACSRSAFLEPQEFRVQNAGVEIDLDFPNPTPGQTLLLAMRDCNCSEEDCYHHDV